MSNMEFGRRLATEKDLEKTEDFNLCNIGMHIHQIFKMSFVLNKLAFVVE